MNDVNNQNSLFEKEKAKEVKPLVIKEKKIVDVEEKDDEPMCELKNHSWRDSWLTTSASRKHVIFCVVCIRTKFNDDGTVQEWLLKQGYVRPKDKSDDYENDVYKFKRKTL